jgi:hypothetical protein
MDESNPQIRHDNDHKISEVEVTSMIPRPSEHPTIVALTSLFFIVAGVFWEPYLSLVGLFFVAMLWLECMKWVNWAKEIQELREWKNDIQTTVREAVESGKIDETIAELRQEMSKIPNGRFTKNKKEFDRYCKMEKSVDKLLDKKYTDI